jgi:hypothetical protein
LGISEISRISEISLIFQEFRENSRIFSNFQEYRNFWEYILGVFKNIQEFSRIKRFFRNFLELSFSGVLRTFLKFQEILKKFYLFIGISIILPQFSGIQEF